MHEYPSTLILFQDGYLYVMLSSIPNCKAGESSHNATDERSENVQYGPNKLRNRENHPDANHFPPI